MRAEHRFDERIRAAWGAKLPIVRVVVGPFGTLDRIIAFVVGLLGAVYAGIVLLVGSVLGIIG